jgi:hypothetical protein
MDISIVQTIVVHISQYGFRRWALKSIHSPIEEIASHQRIGHPHSGRVGGAFVHNSLPNYYLGRLPCVCVTTSKLYETDHRQIKTEVAKAAIDQRPQYR